LKRRTGDPWMPAARYGRELPTCTVNLVVRDVPRAANVGGVEMMLQADYTYDKHPWHAPSTGGERRGRGAELRVLGIDPDAVERRARDNGAAVIQPATTTAHGWREVMVEDVDGYLWAVGLPTPPEK
jgi:uncharacterized glyoxalase superfamily protein PhnB